MTQDDDIEVDMIDPMARTRSAWQSLTRPAADVNQARQSWLDFLNHSTNQQEKGLNMQKTEWVLVHRDTLGQRPPMYYDKNKDNFQQGRDVPSRRFSNRADIERVRDRMAAQIIGGLMTIELAD